MQSVLGHLPSGGLLSCPPVLGSFRTQYLSEAEPKRVLCYSRRVSASPCSTVMWIFRCTMRAELRLKAFPQSLH